MPRHLFSLRPPRELDHAGSFTLSLGHSHSPLEEHAGGRAREILPWRGSSYRQREDHTTWPPARPPVINRAGSPGGQGSGTWGRPRLAVKRARAPKQCSPCLTLTLPPLRARGGSETHAMPLPASDAAGGELAAGRAGGQSARGQTGGRHMRAPGGARPCRGATRGRGGGEHGLPLPRGI